MLCNTVRGKGYFGAGREIFDGVAALETFFLAHGDNKRYFHFVSVADLIADAFAGKVDGDGDIFAPECLCELDGVSGRFFVDEKEHELGRRRVFGEEVVSFEKVARGHVAHAETDGRNALAAKKPQQIVVAAAAEERAAGVLVRVVYLEYHARVVVEAARDGRVDDHIVDTHALERDAQLFEVRARRD